MAEKAGFLTTELATREGGGREQWEWWNKNLSKRLSHIRAGVMLGGGLESFLTDGGDLGARGDECGVRVSALNFGVFKLMCVTLCVCVLCHHHHHQGY